jgi:hypothetical protein
LKKTPLHPSDGDDDFEPSSSIPQFCILEGISPATYHKMRRLGYGPRELRVPGTNVVRITAAARRDWHARLEELPESEETKAERRARASRAGKLAAESPLHPCRRPKS